MNDSEKPDPTDYDGLMQANLVRVFGERDPDKRLKAIHDLYTEDAVLNEPHASATGHTAIHDAVTSLLAGVLPEFDFRALDAAMGHHQVGRLRWRLGPAEGPAAITGMDIAHFEGNRIHSLFVFLEPGNG
ncbi:nuclear transport factor 2 family protein [Luteolibacter soli]|uniref:Nuclear transport factor 2 family protein n=1 Tax=Luteolibacter soli TaxID=3135280 RepID=A0ABU9B2V0_9BACT